MDLGAEVGREAVDGRAKDILGPGGVADEGALDGGDGDVEEAVLLVGGQAVELVLGRVGGDVEVLGLGNEGADDGLDEEGVELVGKVYEVVGAFLRGVSNMVLFQSVLFFSWYWEGNEWVDCNWVILVLKFVAEYTIDVILMMMLHGVLVVWRRCRSARISVTKAGRSSGGAFAGLTEDRQGRLTSIETWACMAAAWQCQ